MGSRSERGPRGKAVLMNCVECPLVKPAQKANSADACFFGAGATQVVVNLSHALSRKETETVIDFIAANKDRSKNCPAETIIAETLRLPL